MGLKETICKKNIHIWGNWKRCVHRGWEKVDEIQENRECKLCGTIQWRYVVSKIPCGELPAKYLETKDDYR